jgi:orotate phosphoribosyltransferase
MIFHYYYQWHKTNEKARNLAAVQEHLTYIGALKSRNLEAAIITLTALGGIAHFYEISTKNPDWRVVRPRPKWDKTGPEG